MKTQRPPNQGDDPLWDPIFLGCLVLLLSLGWIMVFSASLSVSEQFGVTPFYFAKHQFIHMMIGLFALLCFSCIPMAFFEKRAFLFLGLSLILLGLLFVPGLAKSVKGSVRWLSLGGVSIQVAEFAKFSFILFLAHYLKNHLPDLRRDLKSFLTPFGVLLIMSVGLLCQPDFGTVVILFGITFSILFIAGVRLGYFLVAVWIFGASLGILSMSAPYRLKRLTAFLDPWSDPFGSGYQLTQSLIAFGRGGWLGRGLGGSIQKCHFLPEPHTDFIFAVIAEELGLVGAFGVLSLFFLLAWRVIRIAKAALLRRRFFEGFLAYGIAIWMLLQTFISVGVNTGLLPTKGLTLPLMSYGGSSMVVFLAALGLIFRIDFEMKQEESTFGKPA